MDAPQDVGFQLEAPQPQENDFSRQECAKLLSQIELSFSSVVETRIPNRLDRLPWCSWHTYIVLALGTSSILDGLEVTLVAVVGSLLTNPETLSFTSVDIGIMFRIANQITLSGLAGTVYIAGAIIGSLIFGYLADRIGRRKLYVITPCVYILATAGTAFSWNFASFCFFRFFTGAGIGGEYSSINSTIDELIPARVRGFVDLAVNGSYWIGAAFGSIASLFFLNSSFLSVDVGWRTAFAIGALLGTIVLLLRMRLPESPRWSLVHGYDKAAEDVVAAIEASIQAKLPPGELLPEPEGPPVIVHQNKHISMSNLVKTMLGAYRGRSVLGVVLMASQAFFYNAIFFTYALVLTKFYKVEEDRVGLFLVPFAFGNFLGPLLLGRLFDTLGRKTMITFTYATSGILLFITGLLFAGGLLNAYTQTVCWSIVFFFSSPAASAAYLTVGEIFPLEVRALAIAIFYSIGTGIGGLIGPALFGALIETQNESNVFAGYVLGAVVMIIAAVTEMILGVNAEQKSLESIAAPLSAVDGERDEIALDTFSTYDVFVT